MIELDTPLVIYFHSKIYKPRLALLAPMKTLRKIFSLIIKSGKKGSSGAWYCVLKKLWEPRGDGKLTEMGGNEQNQCSELYRI